MEIGDLKTLEGIHDITPPGRFVKNGDPICSILIVGTQLKEIWDDGIKKVHDVLKNCY